MGISQSYYNKIEKNPEKISIEMLFNIGKVLEVHPSVLLDFDATNYVHTISNSHFGFRDYVNQNDVLQNSLIGSLKEEIKFLRSLVVNLQEEIKSLREILKQKLSNS